MAEMAEAPSGHKKGGKPRGKKHSTRIDMTPMVDLGFLLVTFFIFTTTLSKPTTMQLLMPADEKEKPKDPPKVNVKEVLILLLAGDNRIFYYTPPEGNEAPDVKTANYSAKGIRKVIQDEKGRVARELAQEKDKTTGALSPHKLTVIIKPTDKSNYGNFVDVLDEMNINEITKYITVDPDPKELEMIKTAEANAK